MQKVIITAFAIALAAGAAAPANAESWDACRKVETYPGREWRPVAPGAYGWNAETLLDAKSKFEIMQSASVVVVHKGRLIADWGDSAERFTAQSVRKGLLNSLVGVLVDDGKLSLDDTLADLGIDDIDPPLTDMEKTATLRDLLHSRSQIYHSALYEVGQWKRVRASLDEQKRNAGAGAFKPGAMWIYNNWDFNALGTIVEQASGKSIGALFQQEIAKPIGMQDFRLSDVEYTTKDHPAEQHFNNVSEHRAYMFNISTRDLARYGVLYSACGKWKSRRIFSHEWALQSLDGIDTSIGRPEQYSETGFGDYGFLWQVDRPGSRRYGSMGTREPAYFATGNRGHLLAVFPYLDLIIAHQVGTRGGVSGEAQQKRATEGSPSATDEEIANLMMAIIAAHPDGATAFMEEE